jgi:hypothetical protein
MSSRHPSLPDLALLSAGDVSWVDRVRFNWHVARCAVCRSEVTEFQMASRNLKKRVLADPIPGFEQRWARLEREMTGNIAVGVAAARCIENVRHHRGWIRAGWLVTGLAVLFAIAWFTHIPAEQNARLFAAFRQATSRTPRIQGAELRTTSDGIAVRTQGATLTLMHPSSAVVALSGSSAMTARFVDEETGQVTITKVYAQ